MCTEGVRRNTEQMQWKSKKLHFQKVQLVTGSSAAFWLLCLWGLWYRSNLPLCVCGGELDAGTVVREHLRDGTVSLSAIGAWRMVYCWFVMTVHSLGCTAHNWARQHQSVRCEPHQVDLWCAAQVFCRGFYSRDFTCTDTKLCSVNTAVSPISSFISWRDSDCCKKIYLAVNN